MAAGLSLLAGGALAILGIVSIVGGLGIMLGLPLLIFGLATGILLLLFLKRGGKRLFFAAVGLAASVLVLAGLTLLILSAPPMASLR